MYDGGMDMIDEQVLGNWKKNNNITSEDLLDITKAVSQVYPMIVLANLTKNTYVMLRDDGFLYNEVVSSGTYEDLIDNNVDNIHSNYQKLFLECFSRERLLKSFNKGKTEVYAELYQKNKQGIYQWVSTHVIRIHNDAGDITHICLNRVLDGIVEERHGERMEEFC
jgi:hypothetical protein